MLSPSAYHTEGVKEFRRVGGPGLQYLSKSFRMIVGHVPSRGAFEFFHTFSLIRFRCPGGSSEERARALLEANLSNIHLQIYILKGEMIGAGFCKVNGRIEPVNAKHSESCCEQGSPWVGVVRPPIGLSP